MPLKWTKSSPLSLARSTNQSAAFALRASSPKSAGAGAAVDGAGALPPPHAAVITENTRAHVTARADVIIIAQSSVQEKGGPSKGSGRAQGSGLRAQGWARP